MVVSAGFAGAGGLSAGGGKADDLGGGDGAEGGYGDTVEDKSGGPFAWRDGGDSGGCRDGNAV